MPDATERFADHTYAHTDFDPTRLAARKRGQGLTASVVIPARNEEATVGSVVATLKEGLLDRVGLVDEVLVVDADSDDGTNRVARAAGARVVRQAEVLPGAGPGQGKGEALWKGLAASSSDLVVFVDADLVDVGPHFVTGLLGPLLTDAGIDFVKASYDRPLRLGDGVDPTGGGRVTELLARPVIASFWPDLAWLAQPLSGEYAGRRALLESLPFVQGYGVELALLVDIVEEHGPNVIAQVDLGSRSHHHQPLAALGRMAAEILHVALDRLAKQGRLVLTDPVVDRLLQPVRHPDDGLSLDAHDIHVYERPPLAQRREPRGLPRLG